MSLFGEEHEIVVAGSLVGTVAVDDREYGRQETRYSITDRHLNSAEIFIWIAKAYREQDAAVFIDIVKRLSVLKAGGWCLYRYYEGWATLMLFDGPQRYVNSLNRQQQKTLCALHIKHMNESNGSHVNEIRPRDMFPRWSQRIFHKPTMSRAFVKLLKQLQEFPDYPPSVVTGQIPTTPVNKTLASIQRLKERNNQEAQDQHAREILAHQPDITAAELVEQIEQQYQRIDE